MYQYFAEFASAVSACLTPIIGLLAAYIAYQQWQTRRDKLKLELFDKRYAVYEGVKNFIEAVIENGYPTSDDVSEYKRKTHDATFLFNEGIQKHINLLLKRGIRLRELNQYLAVTSGVDEEKDKDQVALSKEEKNLLSWFSEQHSSSRDKFAEYLEVNE